MADLTDHVADVRRYCAPVNEAAVQGIVRHLGIALRKRDAALVAGADGAELARLRDGFLRKKLGLADEDGALDSAIGAVMQRMRGDRGKSRVTVCYLLAEHFGKLGLFVKMPLRR